MKKVTKILFALSFLLVLWGNGKTHSSTVARAPLGNIADGMYKIVGEGSHRCLDIPNSACGSEARLQTFACDETNASNSQKFNVVSDGSGYYTITPVHSDLCLEVSDNQDSEHAPIQQNVCSPGKVSQKWAMSQYGVNLQIRAVGTNQCMDVMRAEKKDYGQVNQHPCSNGTNQRWRLYAQTLNRNGVICRASPSHPEYSCSGLNEKQSRVNLGKTLTKARCDEACKASNMVNCQWEGTQ
jgi:hypothetical protein